MGYIYKITNKINNKIYVGKTVTTIANRWLHHLDDYKKFDWHLYRAMRKYGIENFTIEPIEECLDDIINEREIYWIEKLDTFKNGYNSTLGGEGRKQISRQEVINLWQSGKSIKEIANSLSVWYTTIVDILIEQGCYDKDEIQKRKQIEIANTQSNFIILQYTETGENIGRYNSVHEAAEKTGIKDAAIRSAIYQKIGGGGFFWIKEGDELPNFRPIKTYPKKKIKQLTLNNEYIATFSTAAEASKATNTNASSILKVCKKQRKTAGGYLWVYDE